MTGLVNIWLATPDACLESLARLNVSVEAALACGGVGGARIRTAGPLFEFCKDGDPALILPVFDGETEGSLLLADLAAFDPRQPEKWWQYRGEHGLALGMAAIEHAALWQNPLVLFPSPLDWLRSGGDGACILNWKEPPSRLWAMPELIAEDVALGETIDRTLRAPPPNLPKVSVLRKAAA